MKAKVLIETEVEVEVSASDIIDALNDMPEPEKIGLALSGISTCLTYLKNLPEEILVELNDKQREVILAALEEQAARYKAGSQQHTENHTIA